MKYTVCSLLGIILIGALFWGGSMFFSSRQVTLVDPEKGSLERVVSGPGNVEADIRANISPQISGKIDSINVREGDSVSEGEVLFELEAREGVAQADLAASRLEEARSRVEISRGEISRIEADLALARWRQNKDNKLWKKGHIDEDSLKESERRLEIARAELEAARASLELERQKVASQRQELHRQQVLLGYTNIEAPMDGLVVSREADAGEMVAPERTVVSLIDPDTLQVAARIDESLAGRVQKGQKARIRMRTGRTLSGKVSRIDLVSDPATREMTVYISFDAIPDRFALNQETEVDIRTDEVRGFVLPRSCLTRREGESGVLLASEGRAEFQPVRLGPAEGEKIIIRKGVDKDSRVIREPDGVKPGQRVHVGGEG
ncbi:MAG: efflux RND transporter periplasmic adaptor subunit [Desulfohalobiaceae bacterium]